MSLRLLLTLSGSLEILAGLPALITPAPVVSLLLGGPAGLDRGSPGSTLRRGGVRTGADLSESP